MCLGWLGKPRGWMDHGPKTPGAGWLITRLTSHLAHAKPHSGPLRARNSLEWIICWYSRTIVFSHW